MPYLATKLLTEEAYKPPHYGNPSTPLPFGRATKVPLQFTYLPLK